MIFGGNWDPQGLNLHFLVRPDHGERAPAFLLLLHLLYDYLIEFMCSKGHLIYDFDDLIIAFLLILIVFGKQVQKWRKSILIVFQHYPF